MNLTPLLFGAGAIGPFASRVFLPAFLTALMLRFGVHVPWVQDLGILRHASVRPNWFTSDPCLVVLGVLATLETFGQKNPEVRRLFHEFDLYLKPALALLTTAGVMNLTDADFVTHTAAHQAGVIDGFIPAAVALATWRVARARRPVAAAIFDHLEGTHLDHLFSWAEDAWAALGPVLLVLFPVVMLLLTGAVVATLMVVRNQLARAEHAARLPCPQCGSPVYPCAVACQTCRRPVDHPVAVGFLGLSKPYPARNPSAQPYHLAVHRRCPVCAARLPAGRPRQPCDACGDVTRTTADFAHAYVAHVGWRLPRVLTVTFLLGLIPVVGLIAGTVYYRAVIVLPFAEYLPPGKRFLLRWSVRLLFLLLALCQVIPLLGGFVVPAMAAISFEAYRRAYLGTMLDPARSDDAIATALAV
jgi:hypothetical protein